MKNMVPLWGTSVVKDSSKVPSLFSLIFLFLWWDFLFFSFLPPPFSLFYIVGWFGLPHFYFIFRPESPDLWGNHSLHHPFLTGQCSNNDDHHTFIYLHSTWQTIVWLYMNASGSVPGCAMIKRNMYKKWWTVALPQILCQLIWWCKAIWQWVY